MEITEAGRARSDNAVGFRTTREGYPAGGQQCDHQIVGWTRADVGDAKAHRYIFARIDHAIAWLTTLSGECCAAVAKYRQLPSGDTDFPNATTVGRNSQIALHI